MVSFLTTLLVEDVMKEIESIHYNKYSQYTFKFLKKILQCLRDQNIKETSDFISVFCNYNFKSPDIINYINSFVKFYESNHDKKIDWFSKRGWRQSNYHSKNFVLCKLLYDFEDEFFNYVRNIDQTIHQKVDDIDDFIDKLKGKINEFKAKMQITENIALNEPNIHDSIDKM